jgi:hypothetical protein
MTLRKKDGSIPIMKYIGSGVIVLTFASLCFSVAPKFLNLLEVPHTVDMLVVRQEKMAADISAIKTELSIKTFADRSTNAQNYASRKE